MKNLHTSIYLDNGMAARPSDQAIAAMMPFLTERWGTASSPHHRGNDLISAIKDSLILIYQLLGADKEDLVIFTSSGAEAVNHAIHSTYLEVTRKTGKNQFISSKIDEAPTLMSLQRYEEMGCISKIVEPNENGMITPESIAEAITPRTAMVSLSWANGLTGVVHPVAEIAKICKQRGILLHLEATPILGKIFYDMQDISPDFISFNGDQLHGPSGTGGLYIRKGLKAAPFIVGGLEQGGYCGGSFSLSGLVALGKAAEEALESRNFLCTEIARLRDLLEEGILSECPSAVLFFKEQERLPHCTCMAFPGIFNEALLFTLNKKNVFACIGGGHFQKISLTLQASKIPGALAHAAINFSLSRYTTEIEIKRAIQCIGESIRELNKTMIGSLEP